MKERRILFMGTAQFALPSLSKLLDLNQNIIGVYSSPPKKANRGMAITNSPIINYAQSKGLNFNYPNNLKDESEVLKIKELNPDIIIVIAYGLIIPRSILEIPKIGCFNLHGSLLPRWRGAAPIQRAIIEGDNKTGITFMKMDEGLDTGDIVLSKEIDINPNDNYLDLEQQLADLGAESFEEFFDLIEAKSTFISQHNELATYAPKIEKQETRIDWKEDAERIVRRINAYHSNPGAWFMFDKKRVKIIRAEVTNTSGDPGKIVNKKFDISCGSKSIRPLVLKVEGKQACVIEDFLLGNKVSAGDFVE